MQGTLTNNTTNSLPLAPTLEVDKVPVAPSRGSVIVEEVIADMKSTNNGNSNSAKSLLRGEVQTGESHGQSPGNGFLSDDDSTIDGSDWGSEASEEECDFARNTSVTDKRFDFCDVYSGDELSGDDQSFMSSLDGSSDNEDTKSSLSIDDYSYEHDPTPDEKNRRVDKSSRFYNVPARRMSIGEMETVMDTVFRSYNSLSQSLTKKPSQRKLSFAAAMVEQQLFDKSAPACETARGCLNRMESWAKRSDEESVSDCVAETNEGNSVLVDSDPMSATEPSISSTSFKPKKLKSILKLFPRFSKPRACTTSVMMYTSERHLDSNYMGSGHSCKSTPNPRPGLFRKLSKSRDIASPKSPTKPRRQLSIRRIFESDSPKTDPDQDAKDAICASPPQRPRRQLSFRKLFSNNENDTPVTAPARKLSRQGSSFLKLARTGSWRNRDGAPKKPTHE